MIGDGTEVQKELDQVINIDDDDFLDISFLMFQDNDFFSDLFSDHQSQSSSSSLSNPDPDSDHLPPLESILFRDIEEKLLNDHQEVEDEDNQSGYNYLADDFFSDLQLPVHHSDSSPSPSPSPTSQPDQNQDISMDDLLLDVPLLNTNYSPSHSSSDQLVTTKLILNDETSTPESQVSFQNDDDDDVDDKEHDNNLNEDDQEQENTTLYVSQGKETTITPTTITTDSAAALEDKEDDDPISKKRKRQMRNRDAAVKSRERKKMYVKDLEVKSKYLEGECIRLQRLLQCCAAENHALHLQLQEKAFSASRTKQESAVLFLESLLLGSLLWFLSILGLFSPEMLRVQLPADLRVNTENQKVVDLVALGRAKSKSIGLGTLRLFFKSKRCKASRSKMKLLIGNGALVA